MYAIRASGRAYLVGCSVGSLTLGIGMRWRETEVEIVERRPDPYREPLMLRRCVIPENAVKQLQDIGVTRDVLTKVLRPAKPWKFVQAATLDTIREGETYAGCSPMEPIYHVSEGQLERTLRREFMRFGGTMEWGCEAFDAFERNDGSSKWFLRKQYGPGAESEAIISFCNNPVFNRMVVVDDPQRLVVLFDVRTGYTGAPSDDIKSLLGTSFDVAVAVGRGVALHMWWSVDVRNQPIVAWKLISKARSDHVALLGAVHPALQGLMATSVKLKETIVEIPGSTPAIRDDAHHHRLSVMGDALLPVDPFEWRGDNARVAIEEASALVRGFYGNKYHRGDVPRILRSCEQDFISKRAFLLRRDLVDAEHFLAVNPELPRDEDEGPVQLKRVGV